MKKLNVLLFILVTYATYTILKKNKKHKKCNVMVDFSIQDHEHLNNICK
ncbi:hypothetical protein VL10_ORF39 [Staphylococcus phage vB_SauM_VL10]|nr:hypothetical protein VL10_ORF39 [Staphylococcus phage vB_SauM_VL10]